jgi:hypothetical protein
LPLCFSSLLLFSVSDPETWVLLLCIQRLPLFYFYFFFVLGLELQSHTCWQVLYHLSHTSSPFALGYFLHRVLHFCLGQVCNKNLCLSAMITISMHHHTQFIGWDRASQFFLPWLALKHDPPNLHHPWSLD